MTEKQITPTPAPDISQRISGPYIGLLITGILGAVTSFITLIASAIGTGLGALYLMDELPDEYLELYEGGFEIAGSIIGIAVAAFIIYAALKMKDLQQWGVVVTACILAMIPCISPCCIVGLPIGIWCLVVLMKPEVKAAFQ